MLFLPRHNKFYAAIVPIKPLYRYALTLFITGALGYGWLYGIYQPLQAKLQQQTVEIAVLEQQYATRSELNNNLVALQTTVSNLQKALGTYNHKAHDDGSFPLTTLVTLFEKSGLTITNCHTQNLIDHDWYVQYPVVLEATGSTEQIVKMLLACKASSLLLQPTQITLHKETNDIFKLSGTVSALVVK